MVKRLRVPRFVCNEIVPLCLLTHSCDTDVTIILPVVLYGYKTLPLTLMEEHRLRVLRHIFPFCILIQGDQKVSVHRMITVQNQAEIFLTVSVTYHDNVVRIRDNRWG
jgi:hypothetical protein